MNPNRNMAYLIRKYMLDIQLLNNALGSRQLRTLRSLLLPENQVLQGEKQPESIPAILSECEKTRGTQIKKLTEFYDRYLDTWGIRYSLPEYESRKQQMLFDCMAYGFAPDECTYYRLYEKTPAQKRAYVTDLDRKMMQYQLSDFKALQYVFDKTATYSKLKKYYCRDAISVSGRKDFEAFRQFTRKHDSMVIKMVSASSGRGVTIEETDRQNPDRQFSEIISRGRCSIEERIHQAEELNVFNESSVNTVRIMTFYTRHGIVIGPCFFRTGKAGSYVDNGGSGGILVGVDRTTGVLNSDGYDEFPRVFPVHPDSGVPFRGFSLPDWPRCVALVKEMAALLPKVGYIGWDLALSADYGWVVVEANGGSHIMTQFVYDEGCRKEIDGYMADMRIYGR